MFNWLRRLLGGNDEDPEPPKLWKVGDHRVKEVTRIKRQRLHGTAYEPKYEVTRYQCETCEKVKRRRNMFENDCCYEVINQDATTE